MLKTLLLCMLLLSVFQLSSTLSMFFRKSSPIALSMVPGPSSQSLASRSIFQAKDPKNVDVLKSQILQLSAALDRGQAYNPTSGPYYAERMEAARSKIEQLVKLAPASSIKLEAIDGEWELVFTTVKNGIFRSSPFFLAIQEAYYLAGEPEKAELFFKLHELQTCSFGISKVGRVAQVIDAKKGILLSEFDTSIFSLTVIPILGWFKLLPTFGGCVQTFSSCKVEGKNIVMEVDYTTAKPVPGLNGLGKWIWGLKVPVGAVWRLLPWNQARAPICQVELKYLDKDFRIVEDRDGELFVYTRPVDPRP